MAPERIDGLSVAHTARKEQGEAIFKMKPRARQMPVNPPVPEVAELASATECTGLIPSAVRTPGQAHSYAELYAIHEQKPAGDGEE